MRDSRQKSWYAEEKTKGTAKACCSIYYLLFLFLVVVVVAGAAGSADWGHGAFVGVPFLFSDSLLLQALQDGEDGIFTTDKVHSLKEPKNDAHNQKSGDGEDAFGISSKDASNYNQWTSPDKLT